MAPIALDPMPTYDYRCKDCGHEFETQQSFSDDPLTVCPTCGGNLRKVFSAVGIAFKGDGFYKNDSRTSKAKSSSGEKAGSSEKTGSGDSTTTTTTTKDTPAPATTAPASTTAAAPSKPSPSSSVV